MGQTLGGNVNSDAYSIGILCFAIFLGFPCGFFGPETVFTLPGKTIMLFDTKSGAGAIIWGPDRNTSELTQEGFLVGWIIGGIIFIIIGYTILYLGTLITMFISLGISWIIAKGL